MTETMSLKDLLAIKMKPKNYYETKKGTYIITKNGKYYLTCHDEEDAKKSVEKLEEMNWDLNYVDSLKKELGIVPKNKKNKTGFYRVSLEINERYRKGFVYTYQFYENNFRKRLTSVSLKKLRKNVLKKGMVWKPITSDAKKIEKILEKGE